MSNIFFAKVTQDARVEFSNKKILSDYLHTIIGKDITIEIERTTGKRSLSQNAFYWLYLGVIERETGNLASDLHEFFKRKLLPPVPKKILGTEFKIPASTTRLNKHDFGEYLDKICAITGVPIPVIEEKGVMPSYPRENNKTVF